MPKYLALVLGGTLVLPSVGTAEETPEHRTLEEGPSAGTILASESGWVEFLPDAPPAGTTLTLPEGWIRVESVPDDEEPGGGSFGVISAEVLAGAAPIVAQQMPPEGQRSQRGPMPRQGEPPTYEPRPEEPQGYEAPADVPTWDDSMGYATGPAVGPCYEEQEAYTKELFRMAGIDSFDHPLALLQILGETPGLSPWVRFNIFGAPFLGPTNGVSWIDPVRPIAWDEGLRWAAKDLTACVRRELGFDDRLVDPDLAR